LKFDKAAMLLYVVTDRSWLGGNSFLQQIEDTLTAGATFLQLREKEMPEADFLAEAEAVKKISMRYKVPFVINDNVKIALACGADGVHIGQEDRPAVEVRQLLGKDKILGVSVQTAAQAVQAEQDGADYLGVGAVFPTGTKKDAADVSLDTLRNICHSVCIPVVAIGGIHENNILQLKGSGIHGVAVISAIFAQPDIQTATRELARLAKEMVTS